MAALQKRNGSFRILFRYAGKQHSFTLGRVSQDEAKTKAAQVDYLLMRLDQRLASVPVGVGIVDYLQQDGNVVVKPPKIERLSLSALRDRYTAAHQASLELNTLACIQIHFRHLGRLLGEAFCVSELKLDDLQQYVDKRSSERGTRGRKLAPVTIQKELVTLSTAWNWAAKSKLVSGPFPNDGLRFPKTVEKPRFQTRDEIERRIRAGGLSEAEQSDLWNSMYLTAPEIKALLRHVKSVAVQPFIYPMVVFAAHTGARRSEILRCRIADLDLEAKLVTIVEKKRVRGRISTRLVPLSNFLMDVLTDWLKIHAGGQYLFCQSEIALSGKTRPVPTPLTHDAAHDHLKRTLADSKWSVIRGWHTLRHSFVSACANRGIDQRFVEAWAGHMSAEMSRRYAHLYPSTQQHAMARVFG